ncbi:MAG: hypothetical protein CFE21_10255 [Bacteroidetes bacterium B1(2017)]|nr:MAG: hypothetical protein CFE21_10255 [Bacteroidetes bacterium B1(2017)]
MKIRLFIAAFLTLLLASCNNADISKKENKTNPNKTNYLEVFCFHGTRQCVTCKNMKAYTLKALQLNFATQLKDSSIIFQIIDVDEEKNAAIAQKFEATGTALMFNKVVNGKDSIFDLSDFAFEKANDESKYIPQFTEIVSSLTANLK